ncbi:helix-turn-helix domain-containing protein [Amycolatopsis balhimycina]|uniref:helix-turn-helix domain-containing protein n=1 Tax=Amycolatopsis balhimycina TaxID=208443 RepID=UPI000379B896|nr:helix-turn-helix domain-containing protein [Amycolatopsis balhimycina]
MTHVLLPVVALLRRADLAAVIGAALAAKAAGAGHRRIAQALERPAETVRGWLRRFAGRLEAVRGVFTVWLRALDPDPVMPDPGGGAWADAMIAISLATTAAARRFVLMVSPWEVAVAVSGGRLLAPGWPGEWINTSSP